MLCNVFGFCYNSIMPSDDLEWMVNHTGYNEQDVKLLCLGFSLEYPMGGISRPEFEKMFTKKLSDVAFTTLDADGSGYLDLREFLLAMQLVGARTPEDKLEWAFRQYDCDNSGELDQKEMSLAYKSIYQMLNSIGVIPSGDPAEKAEIIFREIDINHDGFLTLDEFLRGCRKDEELMSLLDKLFEYLTKEAEEADEKNEATIGPWRANNEKNDLMAKSNEKVEEFFSRRSSSNAG